MLISGIDGAALNVRHHYNFDVFSIYLRLLQVWLTLTAFLSCHVQQNEDKEVDGIPMSEIIGEFISFQIAIDLTERRSFELACILGPILLRDNPQGATPISPLAKRKFVLLFIR